MKHTPAEVLQVGMTDEWYAAAYAEYLESCASSYADIIAATSNSIAEAGAEEYETLESNFVEAISTIEAAVDQQFLDAGIALVDIDRQGTDYVARVQTMIAALPTESEEYNAIYAVDPSYFDINISPASYALKLDNSVIEGLIANAPAYKAAVEAFVHSELTSVSIPDDAPVDLGDGWTTAKEYITKVVQAANGRVNAETGEISFTVKDSMDAARNAVSLTFEESANSLNAAYTSALTWAAGFKASSGATIADRLEAFNAAMSSYFGDAYAKASDSVTFVRSTLAKASTTVRSFVGDVTAFLGWDKVFGGTAAVTNDSDVSQFTGATPMSAITLDSAKNVAVATMRTIGAVAVAAWEGIKWIGKKVFNVASSAVKAITTNPIDLEKISDSTSYTIDGWAYTGSTFFTTKQRIVPELAPTVLELCLERVNEWIKLETYGGELAIRITSASLRGEAGSATDPQHVYVTLDWQFKPRCLNVSTFAPMIVDTQVGGRTLKSFEQPYYDDQSSIDAWIDKLALITDSSANLWNDISLTTESDCFFGFRLGMAVMSSLLQAALCAAYYDTSYGKIFDGMVTRMSTFYWLSYKGSDGFNYEPSNLDFLKVACGYSDKSDRKFNTIEYDSQATPGGTWTLASARTVEPLFFLWMYSLITKRKDPTHYVFVPYSRERTAMLQPRFRIKTDAENAQIATIIANALLVVVVVTFAALAVRKMLKGRANKQFFKFKGRQSVLQAKMNSGAKLTKKERRQFLHASKKMGALNQFSTGFLSSVASTAADVSKGFDQTTQAITSITSTLTDGTGTGFSSPSSVAQSSVVVSNPDQDLVESVNSLRKLITG